MKVNELPTWESVEKLAYKIINLWCRKCHDTSVEECIGEAWMVYRRCCEKWKPEVASFNTLFGMALRRQLRDSVRRTRAWERKNPLFGENLDILPHSNNCLDNEKDNNFIDVLRNAGVIVGEKKSVNREKVIRYLVGRGWSLNEANRYLIRQKKITKAG